MAYHQIFLSKIDKLEFLDTEIKEKLRILVNQSLKKEFDSCTAQVAKLQQSLDKVGHGRTASDVESLLRAQRQYEAKKEELIKLLPEHYVEDPLAGVLELNDDDISKIIEGFRSSDKKMHLLSETFIDAPVELYINILINLDNDEQSQLLATRHPGYLTNLIKETITLYNNSSSPSPQIEYQALVQRSLLELIYKTIQDKPALEQNEENYVKIIAKIISALTKQKSDIWGTLDLTVDYFLPQIQARLESHALRPKLGAVLRESSQSLAELTPVFERLVETRKQLNKDLEEAQKQLEAVSGKKLTFTADQFPVAPELIIELREREEKIKKAVEKSLEKSILSLNLKIKKYIEENRVLNEMIALVKSETEKAEKKKLLESRSSTPSLSTAPTFFRSPSSPDSRSTSPTPVSSSREEAESIIIEGGLPSSSSTSGSGSVRSVEPPTDPAYTIYAYHQYETAATLHYKFPSWQSPSALALTAIQQTELSFPTGLAVKSPSAQKFNISFKNDIPKTMFTEGYEKEKGETDKGYQERLAVTIICMINNVVAKSTVLNFKSYDPFSLEIAESYVNFLRHTKGLHIEFKNNCSEAIKPSGGQEIFDSIKPELSQCVKEPWFIEARIFRYTQSQQLAKVELRTQRADAERSDDSELDHRKVGPIVKV